MVEDLVRVDLPDALEGERGSGAVAQQPGAVVLCDTRRGGEREAAVVPREPVAGIVGSESAAAGEAAQHPAAYLLADVSDLLSPQCWGVEGPDLANFAGLEQARDDAAVVMDVAVERGAGTMHEADRAAPVRRPLGWFCEDGPR
jgi:hypothetical protein